MLAIRCLRLAGLAAAAAAVLAAAPGGHRAPEPAGPPRPAH